VRIKVIPFSIVENRGLGQKLPKHHPEPCMQWDEETHELKRVFCFVFVFVVWCCVLIFGLFASIFLLFLSNSLLTFS
jgi:hypothetical protein